MSKKLCKEGKSLQKDSKKFKYECKKCGYYSSKEEWCCKPVKLKKSA